MKASQASQESLTSQEKQAKLVKRATEAEQVKRAIEAKQAKQGVDAGGGMQGVYRWIPPGWLRAWGTVGGKIAPEAPRGAPGEI